MLLLAILFVLISNICDGARILGVVPVPSYSHQVIFRPIWKELAQRGHDVVVLTTDPENDPSLNIREIDISFAYDLWNKDNRGVKAVQSIKYNPFKAFNQMTNIIVDISNAELLHPEVQLLLKNETEHFDLVILEYIYPVMFGFAERFKCPYIGVVPLDLFAYYHSLLGNPVHPVLYPDFTLGFEGEFNFWQRLASTVFHLISHYMLTFSVFHSADQRQFMLEQFGQNLPSMDDMTKNVSMMFINVNPAFHKRPLGPAFVTIGGGVQVNPPQPLPKDLQDYLDSAKNGVIYFSLGTNVKSNVFTPEMRKIMLAVFRELPYTVLWKFDVTDIPDVPDNVKIVNWVPQQDILRHPNIKVFITQGGLQSMEEAVCFTVPLVGIPFMGDQDGNVKKIVRNGFGVYVDKNTLSKDSVKEAVLEVINNPKYKQKIVEVSEFIKDQPMSGLEKAIWWTEYVLRHKGAPHFKSPAIDLPLYQYYLLDVLAFVSTVLLVLFFIIYKTVVVIKRLVLRLFRSNKKVKNN